MRRLTKTELFALLIALLILVGAVLALKFGNDWLVQRLALTNTVASILSLLLVLVQLSAVRESAQVTKETAAETRLRLFAFLTAMDIAKNLKTIQEIQFYNRTGKIELSLIRTQELKSGLTDVLNNERLKSHIRPQNIQRQISELSVILNSLEKELQSPSNALDVVGLNQFLESVANSLDILQSKTKHEGISL